jgi:hypothetical protein
MKDLEVFTGLSSSTGLIPANLEKKQWNFVIKDQELTLFIPSVLQQALAVPSPSNILRPLWETHRPPLMAPSSGSKQ